MLRKLLLAALLALIPGIAAAQNCTVIPTSGATAAIQAAASCVEVNVANRGTVGIDVRGAFTGTYTIDATIDKTNWTNLSAPASGAVGSSRFGVAGWRFVRVHTAAGLSAPATVMVQITEPSLSSATTLSGSVTDATIVAPIGPGPSADGVLISFPTDQSLFIDANTSGGFDNTVVGVGECEPGVTAASTNAANLTAVAGKFYFANCYSTSTTRGILKLYDVSGAPNPASDTVIWQIGCGKATTELDAGSNPGVLPYGLAFSNGLGMAVVSGTSLTDNTATGAGILWNVCWKD